MAKQNWGAIAAAIASVITALLAALGGLGEHAPGVVAGLLLVTPVFYLYFQREREIAAERKARLSECQECEKQQRALGDRAVSAIEGVEARMAAYERSLDISAQIAGLGTKRKSREGRESARTPGEN